MQAMLIDWADENCVEEMFRYGVRLKREFQATLVKALYYKSFGGVLLNSETMLKWNADPENKALLSTLRK